MDETEILIALNLEFNARSDFITIDLNLHNNGECMVDLLRPGTKVTVVRRNGRNMVQVALDGLEMAIFKKQ